MCSGFSVSQVFHLLKNCDKIVRFYFQSVFIQILNMKHFKLPSLYSKALVFVRKGYYNLVKIIIA